MELEMGETKQKHLYISRVEEKGMWMNETWEEPTQWLSIIEIFYELDSGGRACGDQKEIMQGHIESLHDELQQQSWQLVEHCWLLLCYSPGIVKSLLV